MAARTLDLEVLRKNRLEDRFQVAGDPRDADWLRRRLREWLLGHKWSESLWGEFELIARNVGEWKQQAKVRA